MAVRYITVKIKIAGKDVTRDLSPYLLGVTYEDAASGETDTCEVELMDVERLFINEWFPTLGDTLELELTKVNWGDSSQENINLGLFEVDEVANSYPPSICKIKGNSVSQNSALRQTDKSRSWEHVRLSEIAQTIANEAGLILFMDTDDPEISRAEQSEISSLAFLEKLCEQYYFSVKIADGKLIIFDSSKREQSASVMTLDRDSSIVKQFSARETLQEVYKSAEVSYKHGQKDEKYIGKFDAPGKTTGKILKINQKVETQAEAEKLARDKLRDKNKDETKISLTCIGDFNLLSGNVITLKNFGHYDGRYLIEKARHKVSGGYETSIEIRKCLGY